MRNKIIVGIVMVIALVFIVLLPVRKSSTPLPTLSPSAVEISVLPRAIGENLSSWEFNVELTTHASSLEQDMLKISTLTDFGTKKLYTPIAWDGDPPGGHHRSGILKFNAIDPYPSWIIVTIEDQEFNFPMGPLDDMSNDDKD